MTSPQAARAELSAALAAFADGPLREGAAALFGALGYRSERTGDFGSAGAVAAWLDELAAEKGAPLTDKRRALFAEWRDAELLFQLTDSEIAAARPGPRDGGGFDSGRVKSFLFAVVELPEEAPRTRTRLADMARAVNACLAMPAIVLFRHGGTATLAAVHRRAHKRDDGRDALARTTLVKDVQCAAPHRAHLDILADLALPRLVAEAGARDFDGLHRAWERALDIEALNRRFYRELFAWFERAAQECRFPDDGAGPGSAERHVIRLVTRLLFVWFLAEKGLAPREVFTEAFARSALAAHAPDGTGYYRAVFQNLFFATLNTEIPKRGFGAKGGAGHRDFTRYRYRDLLADPDEFIAKLREVPFVNGGLFDCLDDFAGVRGGGRRIDAFTDNPAQGGALHVPARLFFDGGGLFPLFRRRERSGKAHILKALARRRTENLRTFPLPARASRLRQTAARRSSPLPSGRERVGARRGAMLAHGLRASTGEREGALYRVRRRNGAPRGPWRLPSARRERAPRAGGLSRGARRKHAIAPSACGIAGRNPTGIVSVAESIWESAVPTQSAVGLARGRFTRPVCGRGARRLRGRRGEGSLARPRAGTRPAFQPEGSGMKPTMLACAIGLAFAVLSSAVLAQAEAERLRTEAESYAVQVESYAAEAEAAEQRVEAAIASGDGEAAWAAREEARNAYFAADEARAEQRALLEAEADASARAGAREAAERGREARKRAYMAQSRAYSAVLEAQSGFEEAEGERAAVNIDANVLRARKAAEQAADDLSRIQRVVALRERAIQEIEAEARSAIDDDEEEYIEASRRARELRGALLRANEILDSVGAKVSRARQVARAAESAAGARDAAERAGEVGLIAKRAAEIAETQASGIAKLLLEIEE